MTWLESSRLLSVPGALDASQYPMLSNAKEEADWDAAMRERVAVYIRDTGVAHGAIGEAPAWKVFPVVSVWAIESGMAPGQVGWWVIAGDCPTDYVACTGDRTPRSAVEQIWVRWKEVSEALAKGEQHPDFAVGNPKANHELAPLLAARSEILRQYAIDDDAWDEANKMANRYAPPHTGILDSSTGPGAPLRPTRINLAVAALCVAYGLSLVHSIIAIGSRWLLWPPQAVILTQIASDLFYVVLILGIANGRNWARLLYTVLLVIRTANIVKYFSGDWESSRWLVIVTFISFACQYSAMYLLYTGTGRKWFTRSLS